MQNLNPSKERSMLTPANEINNSLDSLDFSELLKLQAILFNTPEAEQAKIQMIKEELASGRYQIHAANIADKLQEFSCSEKKALNRKQDTKPMLLAEMDCIVGSQLE